METRLIDVQDDSDCALAYDVITAAKALGRPWNQPDSLHESVVEWRHHDPTEHMEMWAALDEGRLVGVATMWLALEDNLDKSFFEVVVHPDDRRRGVGRALVERLVARTREEGRSEMLTASLVPPDVADHPYLLFAAALGFEHTSTDVARRLVLPVSEDVLAPLEAAALPAWEADYELQTYVDGVPMGLRDSLCAIMSLLIVDAPSGEVEFDPETFSPARYEEYLQVQAAQGRTRITTVAVHRATGRVAAYTDLSLPAAPNPRVWQWGTYVDRAHRGHRLGTAVKIANLRELQRRHPERDAVITGNDETNRWMVDINLALGFEVQELEPHLRRRLV